jgi:LysR family transcriptional activator of nhaA
MLWAVPSRLIEIGPSDVVLLKQAPPCDALTPLGTHRLAERPVSLMGTPARMRAAPGLADRLREHPIILLTVDSSLRTTTRWPIGRRSSRRSRTWR